MSAVERSGWRDEEISTRHRLYGHNVPATDIDFLLVEYDQEEPVALIDYKKRTIADVLGEREPDSSPLRALAKLGLPLFVVRYEPGPWLYDVDPRNEAAWSLLDRLDVRPGLLDEREYVSLLYRMRGRDAAPALLDYLDRKRAS